MKVQQFTINVRQEILDDLRERLDQIRWPDEVKDADWDYGTNLSYLKSLAEYWQNEFDWRTQEARLNQFSQFCAEVDGLRIHFIHERGMGPNPRPLILLHGWPDSFIRYCKVIPMLIDPARYGGDPADAFDVVVPSLPGFGFTDRPQKRGQPVADTAVLFERLMTDGLGYKRFGAAGGDGGSPISQYLALKYPKSIAGIHLTDMGWHNTTPPDSSTLSEAEKNYLKAGQARFMQEGAYAMVQMNEPQTLAYGLTDSPVGLAGWIVEKFRSWSDCGGDIEKSYTKDELLTNIMIYWVTQTINASIRRYYEEAHKPSLKPWQRIDTPAGFALFPADNPPPREMAERSFNVQRWTEMPHGGHFGAWEEPKLYAEDIRMFFRSLL
jgi:pimeloyl-ACP methyl ester carboxylesterase